MTDVRLAAEEWTWMDVGVCIFGVGGVCERYHILNIISVASEVYGGFTLTAVPYRHSFTSISSADSRQLTSRLQSRLLSEMYQFGLPGLFQVSISSLTNRCL